MKLLDFKMPPFSRIVWGSDRIREEWEPILQKAVKIYYQLEQETVVYGLRSCTTAHISNQDIISATQSYAKRGLIFQPIQAVGSYSGFAHTHPPVIQGKPWAWYGVLARNIDDAMAFAEASDVHGEGKPIDHDLISQLLGYPKCCFEFFNNVWRAGYIDPIWQQATNVNKEYIKKSTDTFIRIKAGQLPPQSNVMLRYIGARLVPHIPCSHSCEHTVELSNNWLTLAESLGMDGLEPMMELLSMPVEWDCLRGITYVSTPIFKIETNSMTSDVKYIVQREGTFYPESAPSGLKFPWNESWKFHGIKSNC